MINRIAAGLAIIYNKKLLLIHPTNARWFNTYGIPKGKVEDNESILEAAIREVYEETGITIPLNLINKKEYSITYKSKKVYYFIVKIDDLSQINLDSERVPKSQLQLSEVDWAGFLDIKDATKRIMKHHIPIINHLKTEGLLESEFKTYTEFKYGESNNRRL